MIFVSKPAKGGDVPPSATDEHAEPQHGYAPPPAPAQAPAHGGYADAFGSPAPAAAEQPASPPPHDPAPTYAITTAIVAAMLEEAAAVATEPQALGFFAALGHRIGAAHGLGGPTNLVDMEAAANGVLGQLGWGRARLLAGADGIRIIHQDWPAQLTGDPAGRWADAFPLILASVYDSWFGTLGAPGDLRTTVVTRTRKAIEFRHGRGEG